MKTIYRHGRKIEKYFYLMNQSEWVQFSLKKKKAKIENCIDIILKGLALFYFAIYIIRSVEVLSSGNLTIKFAWISHSPNDLQINWKFYSDIENDTETLIKWDFLFALMLCYSVIWCVMLYSNLIISVIKQRINTGKDWNSSSIFFVFKSPLRKAAVSMEKS